jgi:hypothetical protein
VAFAYGVWVAESPQFSRFGIRFCGARVGIQARLLT